MYMEDLDLNYRLARAGWVTWYEPSATVFHVKAGTSGEVRGLRLNRAFHYGMYRFYRKHYAPERNPLVNAAVYAGFLDNIEPSEWPYHAADVEDWLRRAAALTDAAHGSP